MKMIWVGMDKCKIGCVDDSGRIGMVDIRIKCKRGW